MEAALLAFACPVGMLAMMGGMAWMAARAGSDKTGVGSDERAAGGERREASHA